MIQDITESEAKSLVGETCRHLYGKLVEVTAINSVGEGYREFRAVFRYLDESPDGCIGMGECPVDSLMPTTDRHKRLLEIWRDRVNYDA
jgi:hypothetical protein